MCSGYTRAIEEGFEACTAAAVPIGPVAASRGKCIYLEEGSARRGGPVSGCFSASVYTACLFPLRQRIALLNAQGLRFCCMHDMMCQSGVLTVMMEHLRPLGQYGHTILRVLASMAGVAPVVCGLDCKGCRWDLLPPRIPTKYLQCEVGMWLRLCVLLDACCCPQLCLCHSTTAVCLQTTSGIIDNLQALDTALRAQDEVESKQRLESVLASLQSTVDAIDSAIRA